MNTLKKKSPEEDNYKRVIWTRFEVRKEVTIKNAIGKEQMEESLKKKIETTQISFADLDKFDVRELTEQPTLSFPKGS